MTYTIYALDIIVQNQEELQKWIYDHSENVCGVRDLSVAYFDCTNYYFDIGYSDMDELNEKGKSIDKNGNETAPKYRKRGPEKNHRPDPIVEMGLLMDRTESLWRLTFSREMIPRNYTFVRL